MICVFVWLLKIPGGYVTITPIDKRDNVNTQWIWRGNWSPQTANMKTAAASTVIRHWTFMTHSIASAVCRLSEVGPCGLGSVWAGVSTFTFAPLDLYWGDRKHTSVRLTRVILCQVLPGWIVQRGIRVKQTQKDSFKNRKRSASQRKTHCIKPLWGLQPDLPT